MYTGSNEQRSANDSAGSKVDLRFRKTTMSDVLTQELGMKHIVPKSVLRLPLPEQKEHHAAAAKDLIHTVTNEPEFIQVITS